MFGYRFWDHCLTLWLSSNNHDLDENNKNANNGNSGPHNDINIQELNQINSQNSDQYLVVAGMDNTNGSSSDVEMENGHTTNGCFKNGNSNNIHDSIDGEEDMGKKLHYFHFVWLFDSCLFLFRCRWLTWLY